MRQKFLSSGKLNLRANLPHTEGMRPGLLLGGALSGQLSRDRAATHHRCCSSGTGLQTCWVAWSSGQNDISKKYRVQPSQPAPTTLLETPRRSLVSSCQGLPSLTCFSGSCGSGWVSSVLSVLPKAEVAVGSGAASFAPTPPQGLCSFWCFTVRRLSLIHLSPSDE